MGTKRLEADALLAELGDDAVLIDSTSIYRALGGRASSPESDSQRFRLARILAGAAVRQANEQGLPGLVTSSSGRRSRLTSLAEAGGGGRVFVVDPGRSVVCARLEKLIPNDADRLVACKQGVERWYSTYAEVSGDIKLSGKRERIAMSEIRCAIEIRDETDGGPGRIVGTLLTYGERAGDRAEVFAPGSLTFAAGGLVLNRQHERRNPIMRFTPELRGRALVIDAKLPSTAAGKDAAAEVKSGLMRGLSIEFNASREENRGGVRTILAGVLQGAGISR